MSSSAPRVGALARPGRDRLRGGHRRSGARPTRRPGACGPSAPALARAADLSANPHVRRGNALEDAARRAFEERHGTLLLPLCGESDEHPVLRASFDGIADDGSPVELKVPAERTFAEVAKRETEAPAFRLYWPQVQHQLYVAGCRAGLAGVLRRARQLLALSRRARRGIRHRRTGARLPRSSGRPSPSARSRRAIRHGTSTSRSARSSTSGPSSPASTATCCGRRRAWMRC